MSSNRDDNEDASSYELFVRRTFNCDRGDNRFPFADGNVWVGMINKWNFANDHTRSKNSQPQRSKEFDKYFEMVQNYFDKTIEHVLKKHATKEGRETMLKTFEQLKSDVAGAKSIDDLRAVINKSIACLDEFNVVLR